MRQGLYVPLGLQEAEQGGGELSLIMSAACGPSVSVDSPVNLNSGNPK